MQKLKELHLGTTLIPAGRNWTDIRIECAINQGRIPDEDLHLEPEFEEEDLDLDLDYKEPHTSTPPTEVITNMLRMMT
jgi:hypothetical protein